MMPHSTVEITSQNKVKGIFQQPLAWVAACLCMLVDCVVSAIDVCCSDMQHFFTLIDSLLKPHTFFPTYIYNKPSFSLPSPPPDRKA